MVRERVEGRAESRRYGGWVGTYPYPIKFITGLAFCSQARPKHPLTATLSLSLYVLTPAETSPEEKGLASNLSPVFPGVSCPNLGIFFGLDHVSIDASQYAPGLPASSALMFPSPLHTTL